MPARTALDAQKLATGLQSSFGKQAPSDSPGRRRAWRSVRQPVRRNQCFSHHVGDPLLAPLNVTRRASNRSDGTTSSNSDRCHQQPGRHAARRAAPARLAGRPVTIGSPVQASSKVVTVPLVVRSIRSKRSSSSVRVHVTGAAPTGAMHSSRSSEAIVHPSSTHPVERSPTNRFLSLDNTMGPDFSHVARPRRRSDRARASRPS